MQLQELREYVVRRNWSVSAEYIGQGVSGSKESRPALNRLMADAHQRRFDAVLVWKIDRFGRSLKHLVISLAELGALGVAFISFRDNLDLSTPSGRLMFQIIGAMAEFERALIQERVRAGLRNAQAKGKMLGRPRVVVDASKIAAMRGHGLSWAQIQAELRVSKGTAQRAFASIPKKVLLQYPRKIETSVWMGGEPDCARAFKVLDPRLGPTTRRPDLFPRCRN